MTDLASENGGSSDMPLNVTVQGDKVLIYLPSGERLTMSIHDAEIAARRLMDALEIAQGRVPGKPH